MTGSRTVITPAYDLASLVVRYVNRRAQLRSGQVVLDYDEEKAERELLKRATDLMGHGVRL